MTVRHHWPVLECRKPGQDRAPLEGMPDSRLRDIAEQIGLSKNQVEWVERKALRKLRAQLESRGITYADLAPERGEVPEEYEVRGRA